ncbi:DUF1244 domain-containing protein [Sandarakinorhabdus rubra]|uniref:DUF1244 domain-containing protein n=1 Tax=Sandarakinorhabdus rubra TaxID=2672568 RepID=UPI0013DB5D8C|nr:DUF1244 domain-containing protein [Sandarakinorhabdus rubra]
MTESAPVLADPDTLERLEAAAFRRLVTHLRQRSDVQNVDLMGWGGFCRNCLGDWLHEEAAALGLTLSKDEGRTHVYGMSQAEWKAKHQAPASQEQLDRMAESLARNEAVR